MGKSGRQVLGKLLKTFNGLCAYCGRPCDGIEWGIPTLDHATPRSRGGTRFGPNAVLSCLACNQIKGDMNAHEYRYFLAAGKLHVEYIEYLTERFVKLAKARKTYISPAPPPVPLDTVLETVPTL
jgi:5-methylcytosine-specific restriction endonuclease McrA